MPWTMRLHRAFIYSRYESRALAFTRARWLLELAAALPFRRMLARQVPDAALRARLTPDYPVGCKRILLSSDYLAAFARPNVDLVTEGIVRVTASGIETTDGRLIDADLIIYGTGFAASRFLAPMRIRGRGGITLDGLARWCVGLPGHDGAGLSQLFHAVRSEHQPRPQLHHLYAGEPVCPRAALPGRAAGAQGRRGRGQSGAVPGFHGSSPGAAGTLRMERLPQLVPGRAGPQHGQLAGLFTDLPLAGHAFEAVRLPLHGLRGLLQGSCRRRIAC
jgi:hypothetical protein